MSATLLSVDKISKRYSPDAPLIIDSAAFSIREGEFVAVVGPSGCGKTTLLRCLAGLMAPDTGQVTHEGRPLSGPPEWLSVVFQDYNRSLFPWLTVKQNVTFGLKGRSKAEKEEIAQDVLTAVNLAHAADLYPWELSGGMQQRCALARSMAATPSLLLLDEPFASVDAQTKIDLQDMVMRICEERGLSALLVTHDIDEAVLMADRVVVLSARPARVVEEITVDLPRPRDQLLTKEAPRFLELRHHIFTSVRQQTQNTK